MHIAMIGAGYVGLVSGACFADFGHVVTCVDTDPDKVDRLNRGEIPIFEPGLEDHVVRNRDEERLFFTTELPEAVAKADVVFIAVGTPSRRGDGRADLSYVYAAAAEVARNISGYTVVVTKSTVPVGTGDAVERIMRDEVPGVDVSVVSNPEFLREGAAIEDFKRPDRIVIGVEDERAQEIMGEVYRPLFVNQAPVIYTGRRTAELIKYASNAFLATKITFINEMADLCEKAGANVQEVARGIGLDNRIGTKFLHAGPGFGGSCFPKDTRALVETAREFETPSRIVEAVVTVNEARKAAMAQKVLRACGGSVAGKTVALLGLTFKPNTDDMRESPSIAIANALRAAGATVRGHDPQGMEQARRVMPDIEYADTAYACVEDADAVVLVTEWEAYRALDLPRIKELVRVPVFVDLRNVYRRAEVERHGFTYVDVGRG
ncbi:UDP-glucose dehydrogenase family protein [Amorphus orientalis]|uniref:UDP-glucose 6-dehydrogenase n=1 Tax=Amorphus orientalis TaxID=649198 RepID=A0AAE3VPI7_9HYPH|nr:UDP-glucose/GDP-mannose dehydrogenase family protein [Amorphus orientalis]MDQ0315934.1 UDPglucose 6-dehydrogenase [Amorphus orientalis]